MKTGRATLEEKKSAAITPFAQKQGGSFGSKITQPARGTVVKKETQDS